MRNPLRQLHLKAVVFSPTKIGQTLDLPQARVDESLRLLGEIEIDIADFVGEMMTLVADVCSFESEISPKFPLQREVELLLISGLHPGIHVIRCQKGAAGNVSGVDLGHAWKGYRGAPGNACVQLVERGAVIIVVLVTAQI